MLDLREKKSGTEINNQDITITENGEYSVPEGKTGYGTITANVQPVLETLTATNNGEYTPSENKDGFSAVTVNVPVRNPLEYKGLTTLYKASTTNWQGRPTSTIYPLYTADGVTPSEQRSSDEISVGSLTGFVTNFDFPQTITKFEIELKFKVLSLTYNHVITGIGSDNSANRFYCPSIQIATDGYIALAFSANGSSWARSGLTTGQVAVNDTAHIKYKMEVTAENKVHATAFLKKNNEADFTTILDEELNVSTIASPYNVANRCMSLFYGASSSGKGKTAYVTADMTKTRIIVNDVAYVDGTMKNV